MSPEDHLCLNISTEPLQNRTWTRTGKRPGSAQDKWARKKQRRLQQETTSDPHRKQEVHPEVRGQHAQAPPPEQSDTKPQNKKKDIGAKETGAKERRQKKTRLKDRGGEDTGDKDRGDKERGDKDRGDKRSGGSFKTSSLFKHNPEIPVVQRSSVCPLKETVFSSSSFEDLDLHPHLVATLSKVLNISTMTSVQQRTIPALMSGRDAVVRSQTGSGKTLSYAVPVVQCLQGLDPKVQRSHGPLAVVLVPTRELALQTFQTFQKLLKPFSWIVPGILIGGEKRKAEKARLRKGINVLVATPGRLVDHIRHTLSLAFSALRWLVLDEADRTLDLGFEKELTVVLNSLNSSGATPQNVLLSATISPGVTRLVDVCLKDPITIQVSDPAPSEAVVQLESSSEAVVQSESFSVPEGLKQFVVIVPSKVRLVCLSAFILDKTQEKVLVFVSSCEVVDFLHLVLSSVLKKSSSNQALSFLRLHGNMKQEERSEVFRQFSEASSGVLLCTDVAARGLHLPQVSWIVQFSPPSSVSEYVHRVGRTARVGQSGQSLIVLCPHESEFIRDLNRHRLDLVPLDLTDLLSVLLRDHAYKGRGKYHSQVSRAAREQEIKERATVLQTQLEDFVHSDPETLGLAKRALQSYLRSYTSFPSHLRHIFHLRHLHLGHSAKSFGLRDAPKGLAGAAGGTRNPAGDRRQEKGQRRRKPIGQKRVSELLRSEFSSGLQPKTKKNQTQDLQETGES